MAGTRFAPTIERIDSTVARVALFGVAATREREAAALAGVAPFTLMARAGDAVARLALALAPHAGRILIFAGPGNNGGDGIEAATRLREFGKDASVVRIADAARLPADAAHALARAMTAGVRVIEFAEGVIDDQDEPDLVIDALLGIGVSRPPEGRIADAVARIAMLAARGARVLAVDVPSGFDVDHGQALGTACVSAHDTLTLLTVKPGLFTASGRDFAGQVWFASLGDKADDAMSPHPDAWLVGTRDPSCTAGPRKHAQHKGSFGDVAVVGGGPGMTGAAWLAARAAHAAGAGRVFVDLLAASIASPSANPDVDPLRPETMFRPGWWQGPLNALTQSTVVCGCGGGDAVRQALPRLLSAAARLVLDADALNAIATDASLQTLLVARGRRGQSTILTPHPLEAARLLAGTAGAVQADRPGAARELAARFGAVIVLKGSGTVIAAPGNSPRINATGNASLAGAGTGDVLAGWIGGRWAGTHANAFDLATRCVIEHGAAAEPDRPGAMRAGDLVEELHRRSRAA